MKIAEKYNNLLTGIAGGVIVPIITFAVFYLMTSHGLTLSEYFHRVEEAGNITHLISVSAFSNIIIFLLFNRLNMMKASKGVLGITFIWAFVVFGIWLF